MSGYRWCTVSVCCVVTILQAGCQSDGSSRMAWNPFLRRAEKDAVTDEPSFSLPKFVRGKSTDEKSQTEQPGPLMPEDRLEALLEEGQLALQESRLDDARKSYAEILSAAPDNATAHHGIAMTADLSQRWADAEYHYKQALRIRPRDANLLCDIGYSYFLQNRFSEASRYLNQAIEVSPQHESAHMNLALLELRQGNRAAAEERIVQRFGSSAAATQVMAQLESRIASNATPVTQASASTILPANATLEQVEALAAQLRTEAEQRRANRGLQPLGENQLIPPASALQHAQPSAMTAQYAGGGYSNPALNAVQILPQQNTVPRSAFHPDAMINPTNNAAALAANATVPGASFSPAADTPALNTTTPGNWNPTVAANMENSQPPNFGTPNAAMPNGGTMSGRVVPIYSSGTFRENPASGASYGQPVGFGTPPGLVPVNTVGATNERQNEMMLSPGMQGSSVGHTVPQVHLDGLNVGPGALFPIGQPASAGDVSSPSVNGTGFNGAPVNGSTMTAVQPGTRGGIPAGDGSLQMGNVSAPGTNSMINGSMYTQPVATLPAQEWAMRQQQIQQAQGRGAGPNNGSTGSPGSPPGAWPSAQPVQTHPLAGYERQLQQIDNQYNSALQQMDGRSLPNLPTAQY